MDLTLLKDLDSNKREDVEVAKQKFIELLGHVKDSWLVHGLYDHFLSTNSANTIVILVNVKEPQHLYLFDRLSDSIGKSSKTDVKVQALTLLGHVVRNQPTWLYKLPEHQLLKALLKLLKCEVELLPLLSALLVLIVLIPMIPYSMGELLNDIFEIFSRLASWNCTGTLADDQMVHMQIALYALFLRLYGMFPCNFLAYLRTQYKDKNRPIFVHTIKPMLETVKMNPSLVTTSKDNETTSERWKKMEVHDVIVECERFSLDVSDTCCAHDSCQLASGFRSRSGTANSALEASYFQSLKNLAASMSNERPDYFSPSMVFNPQTPPIGGVAIPFVSQPEFTHDENVVPQAGSSPPETAIEATPETTPLLPDDPPVRSQAQYPPVAKAISSFTSSPTHPHSPKERSPFTFPSPFIGGSDSPKLPLQLQDRSPVASNSKSKSPTSPLRIKTGTDLLKMSPTRSSGSSGGPDEELMGIERIEQASQPTLKQSDSVLHESEDSGSDHLEDDRSSPCTAGGLHMPNSKSLKDFAKHVQRLRHHSQCNPDLEHNEETSSSSPEMGDSAKVRRANSCPEMKKSPVSSIKDNASRTLDETDEEERAESAMSNGVDGGTAVDEVTTVMTQTENFWPMPYEHLFLGIFPSLGTAEVKASPGTAPINNSQEKCEQPSIYEVLDKYLETAVSGDRDGNRDLQKQLQLLHQQLLFERHRREIHAFKNRRFLADAKSTQQVEEHNSALRDQVQLQQTDIDYLRSQLEGLQREKSQETRVLTATIARLEDHCKTLEHKNRLLKESEMDVHKEVEKYKAECLSLTAEKQKVEAALLDALVEVKFAKEKASAGEKGRAELEYVNKQLLLIGELQLKYREKLQDLNSRRRSDKELELFKESYGIEHRNLTQRLRETSCKLDAYVSRVAELEQLVQQYDETISAQKRTLNGLNEDHDVKIKAIEHKYQTQLTICRSMDEKMLELWHQLEERMGKAIRSPDTSSCQEVQVSSDKVSGGATGVSERSSPLSVSLASSDGSSALAQADMRGLKALVDEESPGELKFDPPKEFDQPSTSRHD